MQSNWLSSWEEWRINSTPYILELQVFLLTGEWRRINENLHSMLIIYYNYYRNMIFSNIWLKTILEFLVQNREIIQMWMNQKWGNRYYISTYSYKFLRTLFSAFFGGAMKFDQFINLFSCLLYSGLRWINHCHFINCTFKLFLLPS